MPGSGFKPGTICPAASTLSTRQGGGKNYISKYCRITYTITFWKIIWKKKVWRTVKKYLRYYCFILIVYIVTDTFSSRND